jgi:hypothetical protein
MIISASYKTDIPTFYGRWFLNRLDAGFCRMVNPYNHNQHFKVSLLRPDVDGFVFWTKNIGPFIGVLGEVTRRGFPFIVQHTINGYPRELESRVVDPGQTVRHVRQVADRFGPRVVVWRYDPIIFSSLTDAAFHRRNFEALARSLNGCTDEVVVSFLQTYQKTQRNMRDAARAEGFTWEDPESMVKRALLHELSNVASEFGMRLSVCTQPEYVAPEVGEARCVDAARLSDVSSRSIRAPLKGMRAGCGCHASKDIGDYDTCPHGCVYCYAVRDRDLALRRFKEHDPDGEYLFPTAPPKVPPSKQLRLLGED